MCIANPIPVSIPEITAYKIMINYDEGKVQSCVDGSVWEFGKEYEAELPKSLFVSKCDLYDRGFHAYANMLNTLIHHVNSKKVIVEVTLKDVRFTNGDEYVANKCIFKRIVPFREAKEGD